MIFRSIGEAQPAGLRVWQFAGSDGVDRAIAQLNIEHFRRLLSEETDEAKRQLLLRLLAEEEAKLATLDNQPEPPENDDDEDKDKDKDKDKED